MEIMELAAELGRKIKADSRVAEMNKAQEAYEADKTLQEKIAEYNAQSEALGEEYKKPKQNRDFIRAIEDRVRDLYEEIMGNPNMTAFTKAQDEVNEFMSEVNGEITFQITGERPCSCGDGCSSCGGGCCH